MEIFMEGAGRIDGEDKEGGWIKNPSTVKRVNHRPFKVCDYLKMI